MTDFSRHLTSEQATTLFSGPLFFEGREDLFEQDSRTSFAADVIRGTRIIILYDDETGCTGRPTTEEATRRINQFIAGIPGLTLPPNPIGPDTTPQLFMGKPACFFDQDSGQGVAFIRQPSRKTSLTAGLASMSGLKENLIDSGLQLGTAEIDNLFMVMQLRVLADEIALRFSEGAYRIHPSQGAATSIGFFKAVRFYETHGGNPLAAKTYRAARMVQCLTQNIIPLELLGFFGERDLQNILCKAQMDIYACGQERPPTTEAEYVGLAFQLSNGAPIEAPVLVKGLKGAMDGLIAVSAYPQMDVLLADYAIFSSYLMSLPEAKQADRDYLSQVSPEKMSTLAHFHVLSGALTGLRHLTGPHFQTLTADRNTDALIAKIAFATAPQHGAGHG